MALPEEEPIPEIVLWFQEKGLDVEVHQDPPAQPEQQSVSRELRDAPIFTYWCSIGGARWFGGGWTHNEAIRSARRRWRVEQDGESPGLRTLP
jgi:hypothetical protein